MFQLRYLQTLNSISAENNSTIVFPVPIDIMSSFMPPGFWTTGEDGAFLASYSLAAMYCCDCAKCKIFRLHYVYPSSPH